MKKALKIAILAGGAAVAAKLLSVRKSSWRDLTEAEVREKLDARMPTWVSDERREAVAEKAVSTMRERGVLRDEDAAPVMGAAAATEASGDATVAGDPASEDGGDGTEAGSEPA